MNFWNKETEIRFFEEALRNFASSEQLFYKLSDGYFAYAPKGKLQKDRRYKAETHS